MKITLIKAELGDAEIIHQMQIKSFNPLLERYQDYDISPGNEKIDAIIARLNQPFTDYYLIQTNGETVGAIRIVIKENKCYRISPIFIVPEFQGKGIAQLVFMEIETTYSDAQLWELDTILQEKGNCYLYEKLGYVQTGKMQVINEKMTIVFYEKATLK